MSASGATMAVETYVRALRHVRILGGGSMIYAATAHNITYRGNVPR